MQVDPRIQAAEAAWNRYALSGELCDLPPAPVMVAAGPKLLALRLFVRLKEAKLV